MRAAPTIFVACGGIAGAALRWGLDEALGATGDNSPWTLFGINTVGSFLLGFVLCASHGRSELARLGLGTGFCGGLTTFSSFAVVTVELGRDGEIAAAAVFVALSVAAALAAVVAGYGAATRTLVRRPA